MMSGSYMTMERGCSHHDIHVTSADRYHRWRRQKADQKYQAQCKRKQPMSLS